MSFIKVKDPRKREELVRDFIETRKRIKDNFVARKVGEAEYQTGLTKLFKPVTETQKATAKEITEAQKTAAEKITKELLPIKEGLENLTAMPIEAGEPIPAIETTKEDITKIGPMAVEYLLPIIGKQTTQSDIKPGDPKKSFFIIGKTPVKIEDNDIIIKDKTYIGTDGLWKLLTSKNIPDKSEYKNLDLKRYIKIMSTTNTTRQVFNRENKRINGNNKMNKLIKPFVEALEEGGEDIFNDKIEKHFKEETDEDEDEYEEEDKDDEPQPGTSGKGLKILPSDPNALIDRFDLLFSGQKAGHTGARNEIISILDELKRQGVISVQEYKKLNHLIKK